MSISVACANCTAKLKIPEAMAGRKIKCPKCSSPVSVNGAEPAVEERRSPRRPPEADDEPRRRREPLDDDPDDVPRRRRPEPRDEDDDLPRRRRRRDEEDSEDIPRKKRKKKAWKFNLSSNAIMWILIISVGVIIAGFFGIRYLVRKGELSPFNNRIGEYLETAKASGSREPYIVGKVLPVNVGDKAVDWFYYEIPDTFRASKPEEVGTVVLLQWGQEQIGTYGTSGGGAFVRTCRVLVVDHARREVVGEAAFRGDDPPRTSRRGSSQYGSYPTEKIVSFIRNLPKR